MPEIKCFTAGYLSANSYIVTDPSYDGALMIDATGAQDKIRTFLSEQGKKVTEIFLTHGHFDHVAAVGKFASEGAKVYIHSSDADMLKDGKSNLSFMVGLENGVFGKSDIDLWGGETLTFGNIKIEVLHTPGHTEGSVCYLLNNNILFSGDTLFYMCYGRTDFPTGSASKLICSIRDVLFTLPDETVVLPGHEESSSIGFERVHNPILADI